MSKISGHKAVSGGAQAQALYDKLSPDKKRLALQHMRFLATYYSDVVALHSVDASTPAQIRARVAIVADALSLPPDEIKKACKGNFRSALPVAEFSQSYNQTLDWLILGNEGAMCFRLALAGGWRPAWWNPEMERNHQKFESAKARKVLNPSRRQRSATLKATTLHRKRSSRSPARLIGGQANA